MPGAPAVGAPAPGYPGYIVTGVAVPPAGGQNCPSGTLPVVDPHGHVIACMTVVARAPKPGPPQQPPAVRSTAYRRPLRTVQQPPPDRSPVPLWADPRDAPPPGHVPFRGQQQATIAGPASQALASIKLSAKSLGVIRDYSVEVDNLLAASNITFTLRINGGPVAGQTYKLVPFGSPHVGIGLFDFASRFYVEVPTAGTMDVFVTIGDANAYLIGVQYAGWSYPQDYAVYGQRA